MSKINNSNYIMAPRPDLGLVIHGGSADFTKVPRRLGLTKVVDPIANPIEVDQSGFRLIQDDQEPAGLLATGPSIDDAAIKLDGGIMVSAHGGPQAEKHQRRVERADRWTAKTRRAAMFITLMGLTGHGLAGDVLAIPREVQAALFQDCPSPSDEVARRIDQALAEPDTPLLRSIYDSAMDDTEYDLSTMPESVFDEWSYNFNRNQAERFGLTIIDALPYLERISQAETREQATAIANQFSRQLGFTIDPLTSEDATELFTMVPLDDDMDLEEYKTILSDVVGTFGYVPRELVHYSGLEFLKLAQRVRGHDMAGGFRPYMPNRLYAMVGERGSIDFTTLMHEFEHMLDQKMCGPRAVRTDHEYRALNPDGFRYGGDAVVDGVEVTATSYGATDVIEDKAEMAAIMINGLDPEFINSESPVIRAKYRLLLERLEEVIPGYGQFLAAVSGKHLYDDRDW